MPRRNYIIILSFIVLLVLSSCSSPINTSNPIQSSAQTEQSQISSGDTDTNTSFAAQEAAIQAEFEAFMEFEINRQFDKMWEMLHPDCQTLWKDRDKFINNLERLSGNVSSYTIKKIEFLSKWTNQKLNTTYLDTAKVQYVRVINDSKNDLEQEFSDYVRLIQYDESWKLFVFPIHTPGVETEVRIAFETFLDYQVNYRWDEMWEMIHPDFQSSFTDKNEFVNTIKEQPGLKSFSIVNISLDSIAMDSKTYPSAAYLNVTCVWIDKSTRSEFTDNGTNIGLEENGEWKFFAYQREPSSAASPAELRPQYILSEVTVDPPEIFAGELVTISLNVTNIGKVEGIYPVELNIIAAGNNFDPVIKEISLKSGETQKVTFMTTGKKQAINNEIPIPSNYIEIAQISTGTQYIDINGKTGSFVVYPIWIPSIRAQLITSNHGENLRITLSGSGIGDTTPQYVENMIITTTISHTTYRIHTDIETNKTSSFQVFAGYLASNYLDITLLDENNNVLIDAKQIPIEPEY